MRKRLITPAPESIRTRGDSWLDVEGQAVVEVTSEDENYPVESAFVSGDAQGWRAAAPGSQTIRLVFDHPQRMLPIPAVLFGSLDFLLSLLSITVLFAMIFKLLPKTRLPGVTFGSERHSPLHWVLHREECSGFRLRGRRLFGGGHRLDLLLLYFGAELTRVRAHAGLPTQRRGPNQCWSSFG